MYSRTHFLVPFLLLFLPLSSVRFCSLKAVSHLAHAGVLIVVQLSEMKHLGQSAKHFISSVCSQSDRAPIALSYSPQPEMHFQEVELWLSVVAVPVRDVFCLLLLQ